MYYVIGAPPSDLGAAHLRLALCLSQSTTSGLPGLPGSPVVGAFVLISAVGLKINKLRL